MENKKSTHPTLQRPPAKPGPRNGLGHQPSSTGEGNTQGSEAGVDANQRNDDPVRKRKDGG